MVEITNVELPRGVELLALDSMRGPLLQLLCLQPPAEITLGHRVHLQTFFLVGLEINSQLDGPCHIHTANVLRGVKREPMLHRLVARKSVALQTNATQEYVREDDVVVPEAQRHPGTRVGQFEATLLVLPLRLQAAPVVRRERAGDLPDLLECRVVHGQPTKRIRDAAFLRGSDAHCLKWCYAQHNGRLRRLVVETVDEHNIGCELWVGPDKVQVISQGLLPLQAVGVQVQYL